MAEGLERDIELLESEEMAAWRHQVMAGAAGLCTAGPFGVLASLLAFRKFESNWLPWALVGVLAAPPLAYVQWRAVSAWQQRINGESSISASDASAEQLIGEADRLARACAMAQRDRNNRTLLTNPLDGRALFCDPSYPTTVVITSQRFAPLQQPRLCGGSTLSAGTRAAQWLVSPAGSLVCQAVAQSEQWWWLQSRVKRQQLYRACTANLRLEARYGFTRTAHQLGRPDHCAQERALLAGDQVRAQ